MFIKINTAFVWHADWHTQFLASTREKYSISSGKMFVARRLGATEVWNNTLAQSRWWGHLFSFIIELITPVWVGPILLWVHILLMSLYFHSVSDCLWWRLCAVCSVVVMDVHTKRDGKRMCAQQNKASKHLDLSNVWKNFELNLLLGYSYKFSLDYNFTWGKKINDVCSVKRSYHLGIYCCLFFCLSVYFYVI